MGEPVRAQSKHADFFQIFPNCPSSNDSVTLADKNKLWLMGSLSGSLFTAPLDSAYTQDFGFWGYALKFGGVWHHRILQFDYHSETENAFMNLTEHRYDYALLYGVSHRDETIFDNLMVGVSLLNYELRGTQLTPPSSPNLGD